MLLEVEETLLQCGTGLCLTPRLTLTSELAFRFNPQQFSTVMMRSDRVS